MPGVPDLDAPIASRDELLAFFEAGAKPVSARRLGVELEWLPVLGNGQAAPFAGPGPCVEDLLKRLARELSLQLTEADGHVLGLAGPDFAVHLEPGAQVELALGPRVLVADVHAELQAWQRACRAAACDTGVHLLALGLQPRTPVAAIGWVPKERYPIMREHLSARGDLAHHMMKATASFQVSLDYSSEAEAGDILRTVLAVSPVLHAAAVNAPLEADTEVGLLSKRALIWSRTDPDRCGLLPWIHDEDWSFSRWLDWVLSVPVMLVVRDGRQQPLDGRTFATFMAQGSLLGPATHADFQLHLTTLFPEARLKQHVEIRGADTAPPDLAAALTAAWKGILHDEDTRARAAALTAGLTRAERARLHFDVGARGLAAEAGTRPVRLLLQRLLDVARSGLAPEERPFLAPIESIAAGGPTPAEALLADWRARGVEALLATA